MWRGSLLHNVGALTVNARQPYRVGGGCRGQAHKWEVAEDCRLSLNLFIPIYTDVCTYSILCTFPSSVKKKITGILLGVRFEPTTFAILESYRSILASYGLRNTTDLNLLIFDLTQSAILWSQKFDFPKWHAMLFTEYMV